MLRKITSLICTVTLLFTLLVGCAGPSNTTSGSDKYSEFPSKLTAEKVATIDINEKSITPADGGIYYRENDKYGVMSFDGKNDTGAIYNYCMPKKNFFMVVSAEPSEEMTIENMNNVGVIDATGKVIVPEKYASIDVLNDRYIKVCEVTEKADSKDDALVFYTERSMAIFANDDDTFFKGNWYVFDAQTGKMVEGVTGTQPYTVTAYGNYIEYSTDDGEDKCVNEKGETLPEGAELLDDGSYIIENDDKGSAYDTNGNKLFDYSTEDYQINYCADGSDLYLAKKYLESGTKYMVVNKKGEIVSAEFDEYPSLYCNYLFVENKLYDFEGNQVLEKEYKRASLDKFTKKAVMLTADNDDVVIINEDGKVLIDVAASDEISVGSTDFTVGKKSDNGYTYYSQKDKDYSIKGTSYGPWVVEARDENNVVCLVDTISGEILADGYDDFTTSVTANGNFYAFGKNEDGTMDVYLIK